MKLSELKHGDIISEWEYNQLYEEIKLCFTILTKPNIELCFDSVRITERCKYIPPSIEYPYGKYIDVVSGIDITFRVQKFDKKKKIMMLI